MAISLKLLICSSLNETICMWLEMSWVIILKYTAEKVSIGSIDGLVMAWCRTGKKQPRKQGSWGQHGAHLGPVGPRWSPCWPHEPCYQGVYKSIITESIDLSNNGIGVLAWECYVIPIGACAMDDQYSVGPFYSLLLRCVLYHVTPDVFIMAPLYVYNIIL